MKSAVETLSPTRVKLTVEVPYEEIEPSLKNAYKRIGAQVTESTPGRHWNDDASKSSSPYVGQVAWKAAADCKSCHDATDDYNNPGFPHAWGKSGVASSKMWLQMAANAGAAKTSVGQAASADTADLQLQDGVCLKCHISPDGASGVGITF